MAAQGVAAGMRAAVLRRLDLLDQAAVRADARVLESVARTELGRLADGWRLLLQVHKPDEAGRCVACPRRLLARRWPCQLWRLAHRHLIGDGQEVGERHRTRPNLRPVPPPQPEPQQNGHPTGRTSWAAVPDESQGELTMELPVVQPRHRL